MQTYCTITKKEIKTSIPEMRYFCKRTSMGKTSTVLLNIYGILKSTYNVELA